MEQLERHLNYFTPMLHKNTQTGPKMGIWKGKHIIDLFYIQSWF